MKRLLGVMMAVAGIGAVVAAPAKVETWRAHELVLTASKEYATGGEAVRLDVTFTHPKSGVRVVRPGFWDGGKTFRVRFAPPKAGGWTWKSACADDAALNGRRGGFLVEAYTGALDVYAHGLPQADGSARYLTHADGTPLLHLAGGAAAGKVAFNVKDGRVDAADLAGLQALDKVFRARAESGVLWPEPAYLASALLPDEGTDGAETVARYLAARYGAFPAVPVGSVPWTADWEAPLRRLFASCAWWELEPEEAPGRVFRAATGCTVRCATKGDALYLIHVSGAGRGAGSIKLFDRAHAYAATWYNPRTGESRGRVSLPGVPAGEELPLPPRPDTRAWVVKVEKLAAPAPHVSALAARGPRDLDAGTLDWTRGVSLAKGVKMLTFDEKVATPLDPADQKAQEEKFKVSLAGKRPMKSYLVRVDLRTPGLAFTATRRADGWGEPMPGADEEEGPFICTERSATVDFMKALAPVVPKAQPDRRQRNVKKVTSEDLPGKHPILAFNTAPWEPTTPTVHDYAQPRGLAISDGAVVSKGIVAPAAFVVWKDGTPDIVASLDGDRAEDAWIVHTGVARVLRDGTEEPVAAGSDAAKLGPRLALGLSRDRTFLYLLAVDGNRPGQSLGAVGADVARLLTAAGAWDALAFDGEGATLAYWDERRDAPACANRSENRKVALNIALYRETKGPEREGKKEREK